MSQLFMKDGTQIVYLELLWLALASWLRGSEEVTEAIDFCVIMCFSDASLNRDWQKYGFNWMLA